MVKIKVAEATGPVLDFLVFQAEGHSWWHRKHAKFDPNHGYTDWVLDTDGLLKKFRFDESCSRAGA
jgi:hypothetical protein